MAHRRGANGGGRGRAGPRRRITRLPPAVAARYAALVAAVASDVEAALPRAVCANRVERILHDPPSIRLAPWREERVAFAARLRVLARDTACLAFADVEACYPSIAPGVVVRALRASGAEPAASLAIGRLLDDLRSRGIRGLPVGPEPSAVLANAVLAPLDRAIEDLGVRHLRWVDDVVAGVGSPAAGEDVLETLRRVAGTQGLRLNPRKSRIVSGGEAARARVSGPRTRVG